MLDAKKLQTEQTSTPEGLPEDVVISPDAVRAHRVPPGQARTRKWPVLDAYGAPQVDLSHWRFEVTGLVETPVCFTWQEFRQLPRVKVFSDFHCVTRWSRLSNLWEGVSTRTVLERAKVQAETRYILVHAYDSGWSTNISLEEFLAADALFADTHDGAPLPREHGGPLRLIVPRLYAWKSAKWVKGIELIPDDRAGFWEQGGYHMHGDPWKEERFR
ncbi:MAG: sulfite oxidase-like oxidoreductase [Terriglobia bacterium]